MRIIDHLLAELAMESETTRRFLESLPADQVGFKPHEKSMTSGQLAMHVATIPGQMADMIMVDVFSMPEGDFQHEQPTREEILEAFDQSLAHARELLGTFDDEKLMSTWTLEMGGKPLASLPRITFVRYWILNHLYHHRGQFGMHLRLMGAHVPSSYGPTVDENFLDRMQEPVPSK